MATDEAIALETATIIGLSQVIATFLSAYTAGADPDRVLEALVLLARERARLIVTEQRRATA
jgi:hypothetical protein